jgi:ATP dependent DNA ligase domain
MRPLPMLATASLPFDSEEYTFEVKWDGVRALAAVELDHWELWGRRGVDYTARYPELAVLRRLPAGTVVDGELVVLRQGRADLAALLHHHHRSAKSRSGGGPAIWRRNWIKGLTGRLTAGALPRKPALLLLMERGHSIPSFPRLAPSAIGSSRLISQSGCRKAYGKCEEAGKVTSTAMPDHQPEERAILASQSGSSQRENRCAVRRRR